MLRPPALHIRLCPRLSLYKSVWAGKWGIEFNTWCFFSLVVGIGSDGGGSALEGNGKYGN